MAWSECLLDPASCLVSAGTDAVTDSWWNSFLSWMARGLTDLTSYVFQAFSLSTAPRFDQQWWRDNLELMVAISLPLLVGVFVLQCVSAAVRREPSRLGHAVMGALLGTAGVPLAVAAVASCGRAVDEISTAILGNQATADGLKRMVDISALLTADTLGGFALTAVLLALLASISLYFVMLIREVAIVAFVVFAPIAMASWTWSATRHWLRRWIEVVGALLFSKVAMAVIFTLGLSATGNTDANGEASIGTFLTGILLVAMAAFAPLATFSFIHWAGDQGSAAAYSLKQGTAGPSALRERVEQAQQWGAHHFGGSGGNDSGPVVGSDNDPEDDKATDDSSAGTGWTPDQGQSSGGPDADAATSPSPEPAAGGQASTAIAVATSQISVDGSGQPGQQADDTGDRDNQGGGS
ncbi:hypothetical protein EV643_103272 [Kribbella sp. VKM Ac-2527]|uniref:TrbL/VirB6 plasmid conjugal transfer protein n=1 Tax=Kribbella caucasensis TaxID=2512215 RepID=A0A4R6KK57_9ACTN|nr:hypothetical protein [Kribbella sp. VKM Ac-2527]TDO51533.1 hypothetical protein EV643_103272 [Kribbella sp. VKM Ac-2527]